MKMTAVQGLGGGFELGATQAGMELEYRTGTLSLGAEVVRGNRPLLNWTWDELFTKDYREWERRSSPVIIGNPPCSAWSTLTRQDLRGGDAKVMECTQAVIDYAGIQPDPPLVIAIESVQQAWSTGKLWYRTAREQLERDTGHRYDLIWVMQSNAALGGASVRKRVFVIYSRIPFGVEYAQPRRVARLGDAIRDLEGLTMTPATQPYARPPTWWSLPRRAARGVDGHFTPKISERYAELVAALANVNLPWAPGETLSVALRRLYNASQSVPEPWKRDIGRLVARNWDMSIHQAVRWDDAKQSPVITGAGPHQAVHYSESRLLTHRECARIQGFPDTWMIEPARNYTHLAAIWGKGVPVDAGRWIGKWIKNTVEGTPGTVLGEPIGERERMVRITNSYQHSLKGERPWEHQRWTANLHEPVEDYESAFTL